jgi:hypothetical protein
LLLGALSDADERLPGFLDLPTPDDGHENRTGQVIGGWSHTFGDRNVASAAAAYLRTKDDFDVFSLGPRIGLTTKQDIYFAGASHALGIGPVTLRYGAEGSWADAMSLLDIGDVTRTETSVSHGLAYADVLARVGDRFAFEAGAKGVRLGEDADETDLLPQIGAAFSPFENHWLRAAYIESLELPTALTLSPVTTLGMAPQLAPFDFGGEADSAILRWDAEWHPRLFTSVEYQHQELEDLSFAIPDTLASVDVPEGRIDRVTGTANLWLGGGFGAFASLAYADSENRTPGDAGEPLPFVPETLARFGLTFAHPSRVKLSVMQTLVADRWGDTDGTTLDDFALTDASLNWEPLDRHIAFDFGVFNLFDEQFELAPNVPGWSRTVAGSFTARF